MGYLGTIFKYERLEVKPGTCFNIILYHNCTNFAIIGYLDVDVVELS